VGLLFDGHGEGVDEPIYTRAFSARQIAKSPVATIQARTVCRRRLASDLTFIRLAFSPHL
jgi:hypothetical protein